jgi:hypothetical protein
MFTFKLSLQEAENDRYKVSTEGRTRFSSLAMPYRKDIREEEPVSKRNISLISLKELNTWVSHGILSYLLFLC